MAHASHRSVGILSAEHLLALHGLRPDRYPVLLESAAYSAQQGRFDILMAFPQARIESLAGSGLHVSGDVTLQSEVSATTPFLEALDSWFVREQKVSHTASSLPFTGGWFVYLSYELTVQIERTLQQAMPISAGQLLAQAVRIPAAIVRERDTGVTCWVDEANDAARWQQFQADLRDSASDVGVSRPVTLAALHEDDPARYIKEVIDAKQHIAAGDIYQANLSRGWSATLPEDARAVDVYHQLRRANPAPFAGLARLTPDHALISSSPERLLEVRDGWASTRPIAGTRPRAHDPDADASLVAELEAHPKERAEHIMLLDLERNDLGRICVGGTVVVNEYMSIETYSHVHHIVSNVRGRLRADVTPGQAIGAVFPGGTITGCPKVRCMQIIAEQEQSPRGAYTGSMGYLNRDGSMDLNILIRTLELRGRELTFRAGAGIVADSVPERELDETRAKALGLLRALPVQNS